MKIAILTDTHWGVRGDSDFFLDNFKLFYEKVFFPTIKEEGVEVVLHLGDFWEHRKQVNIKTFRAACDIYQAPLHALGIQEKKIYGNHDVFYRNNNAVNLIDPIARMFDNVEVVETSKVFDFDGLKIGMISWINNANLQDALKFFETANCDILCGHFEIKDFDVMKGVKCDSGFEHAVFERFDRVLSGHFHVESTNGKIHYIGNTSQTNWSDCGQLKGFRILDTETKEMKFIQNPFDLYVKFDYNDSCDVLKFEYAVFKGKIVRVFIPSYLEVNKNKFNLFIENLSKVAYVYDVFQNSILYEHGAAALMTIDHSSLDTKKMIEDYVKETVNPEKVDAKVITKMALDLYDNSLLAPTVSNKE